MRSRVVKDLSSLILPTSEGPDVHTSPDSKGVERLYWKNDMMTLFFSSNSNGKLTQSAWLSRQCNPNIMTPGRRFLGHSGWHKDETDFDRSHVHVFNDKSDMLPPEDLQCLLQNIKFFEKAGGLCLDGKEDCLLSDKDAIRIQDEYNQYYSRQKAERGTLPSLEIDKDLILDMGIAMLSSFIKTLTDKYLKPLLLDKASEWGIPRHSVVPVLEMLNGLVIIMYTGSLKQALLNATVVNMLRLFLIQSGIEQSLAESVSAAIGNYFTTVRSYLSLLNIGRSQFIMLGMVAAYAVIRRLPKLKYEDSPVKNEDDIAEVVSDSDSDILPEGMTRRNQY